MFMLCTVRHDCCRYLILVTLRLSLWAEDSLQRSRAKRAVINSRIFIFIVVVLIVTKRRFSYQCRREQLGELEGHGDTSVVVGGRPRTSAPWV